MLLRSYCPPACAPFKKSNPELCSLYGIFSGSTGKAIVNQLIFSSKPACAPLSIDVWFSLARLAFFERVWKSEADVKSDMIMINFITAG